MTAYKVTELTGYHLNMAVARADGLHVAPYDMDCEVVATRPNSGAWPEIVHHFDEWKPSTNWLDGGPILVRERIALLPYEGGWAAFHPAGNCTTGDVAYDAWSYADFQMSEGDGLGPTPLIAAMRAYVASKFGETVELP